MPSLSVRSGATAGISAVGETIALDFSADVSTGEVIVAYGVGLAGFLFNYETNSPYYAENMGMLAVRLVPNLVGNVLCVTASTIMTDYDGDAGQSPAKSGTDPSCMVQFTAVALIASQLPQDSVVGNVYAVPNGTSTSPVSVGDNSLVGAFLAGFNIQVSGGPGSISSFLVEVSGTPSGQQMTAASTINAGSIGTNASVDTMLLSLPSSITNVQVVKLTLNFPDLLGDSYSGFSESFSVPFTIPSGYSTVANVGLLQESVNIIYGGNDEFQVVEAYYTSLTLSGSTATGNYELNIYNPDFGSRTQIANGSSASVYAIAQFGN